MMSQSICSTRLSPAAFAMCLTCAIVTFGVGASKATAQEAAATQDQAPFDCRGDQATIMQIVQDLGSASVEQQREVMDACIQRFNSDAERMRADREAGAAYSVANEQLTLQLRLLQSLSREIEPGGRFERNIADLELEIEDLETQIDLQKDNFPERAAALEEDLKDLRADYVEQVEEYGRLRSQVADRLVELTTFRPIIALELRTKNLESVITALGDALEVSSTIIGSLIDANDDAPERETE